MPKISEIKYYTPISDLIDPQKDVKDKLKKIKKKYVFALNAMADIINEEVAGGSLSYSALNINGEVPLRAEADKILDQIDDAVKTYKDNMNKIITLSNEHLKAEIDKLNEKLDEEITKNKGYLADPNITQYNKETYQGYITSYKNKKEELTTLYNNRKATEFSFDSHV